jgi:hypothetical protein
VETAFLHGELQEEFYMKIPEGMSYESKHCLLLTKTMGLYKEQESSIKS